MRSSLAIAALVCLGLCAAPAAAAPQQAAEAPGEGVWRNYDFVPGHTVWRATDFADEPVGRFPASQLEFVRGNLQVVQLEGERFLEATDDSIFRVLLPEALPETFSLEFLARIPTPNIGTRVFFATLDGPTSRHESDYLSVSATSGIYRKGNDVSATTTRIARTMVPVRLQVDEQYAILYVGSERVSQLPNAAFHRGAAIEFHLAGSDRFPNYIGAIVVAVGLDSLYDALMEHGEFTTRGILFDTGSDALRPESTPVLGEILATLDAHPDLRIVIEGHTDAVGDHDANLLLSERRAAAVTDHLIAHGIHSERLAAVGKGESESVADNGTAEGRQQNRRVVIRLQPTSTE